MSNFKRKDDYVTTQSMKRRLLCLFIIFAILLIIVISRLAYLQLVIGDDLKAKAREQQTQDNIIPAKRGIIYDREKRELAISSTAYILNANPGAIKKAVKKENYDQTVTYMAKVISEDLSLKEKDVYKKLTRYTSYEIIGRKIEKNKIDKLRKERLPESISKSKSKLPGLQILEDPKRYYPYNNFLSHVIGFTGDDGNGLQGMEALYDKYLSGTPGRLILETDTSNSEIPSGEQEYIEPKAGNNVILTIDDVIQHYAETALEQALIDTKSKRGSIIAMNPKTGEVLALVNKPDYDLNNPFKPVSKEEQRKWKTMSLKDKNTELQKMWRNFAVSDTYEPGSPFKIITAAAGLEESAIKPESRFYCGGQMKVADRYIKCAKYPSGHGNQNFVEGLEHSCNVVFMTTGLKVGAANMNKYAKAFGVDKPTGIDIPGEGQGLLHPTNIMKDLEVATMSFGQGITVTPMEMINAVCAVANDGKLMKPYVLKQVINKNGKVIVNTKPTVIRQVISKKVANELSGMLEKVVSADGASGVNAKIDGYKIAGKTGTSEKLPRGNGKYVASFVGFAPSDNPQIAIIVILDEPDQASHFGGQIAAPVFRKVMANSLNYLGIQKTGEDTSKVKQIVISDYRGMKLKDVITDLKAKKIAYQVTQGSGNVVVDQSPMPGATVNDTITVRLSLESAKSSEKVTVPDLKNKSAEEANKAVAESRLILNIMGNEGKVSSQSPAPGEKVSAGSEVIVKLSGSEKQQLDTITVGD